MSAETFNSFFENEQYFGALNLINLYPIKDLISGTVYGRRYIEINTLLNRFLITAYRMDAPIVFRRVGLDIMKMNNDFNRRERLNYFFDANFMIQVFGPIVRNNGFFWIEILSEVIITSKMVIDEKHAISDVIGWTWMDGDHIFSNAITLFDRDQYTIEQKMENIVRALTASNLNKISTIRPIYPKFSSIQEGYYYHFLKFPEEVKIDFEKELRHPNKSKLLDALILQDGAIGIVYTFNGKKTVMLFRDMHFEFGDMDLIHEASTVFSSGIPVAGGAAIQKYVTALGIRYEDISPMVLDIWKRAYPDYTSLILPPVTRDTLPFMKKLSSIDAVIKSEAIVEGATFLANAIKSNNLTFVRLLWPTSALEIIGNAVKGSATRTEELIINLLALAVHRESIGIFIEMTNWLNGFLTKSLNFYHSPVFLQNILYPILSENRTLSWERGLITLIRILPLHLFYATEITSTWLEVAEVGWPPLENASFDPINGNVLINRNVLTNMPETYESDTWKLLAFFSEAYKRHLVNLPSAPPEETLCFVEKKLEMEGMKTIIHSPIYLDIKSSLIGNPSVIGAFKNRNIGGIFCKYEFVFFDNAIPHILHVENKYFLSDVFHNNRIFKFMKKLIDSDYERRPLHRVFYANAYGEGGLNQWINAYIKQNAEEMIGEKRYGHDEEYSGNSTGSEDSESEIPEWEIPEWEVVPRGLMEVAPDIPSNQILALPSPLSGLAGKNLTAIPITGTRASVPAAIDRLLIGETPPYFIEIADVASGDVTHVSVFASDAKDKTIGSPRPFGTVDISFVHLEPAAHVIVSGVGDLDAFPREYSCVTIGDSISQQFTVVAVRASIGDVAAGYITPETTIEVRRPAKYAKVATPFNIVALPHRGDRYQSYMVANRPPQKLYWLMDWGAKDVDVLAINQRLPAVNAFLKTVQQTARDDDAALGCSLCLNSLTNEASAYAADVGTENETYPLLAFVKRVPNAAAQDRRVDEFVPLEGNFIDVLHYECFLKRYFDDLMNTASKDWRNADIRNRLYAKFPPFVRVDSGHTKQTVLLHVTRIPTYVAMKIFLNTQINEFSTLTGGEIADMVRMPLLRGVADLAWGMAKDDEPSEERRWGFGAIEKVNPEAEKEAIRWALVVARAEGRVWARTVITSLRAMLNAPEKYDIPPERVEELKFLTEFRVSRYNIYADE